MLPYLHSETQSNECFAKIVDMEMQTLVTNWIDMLDKDPVYPVIEEWKAYVTTHNKYPHIALNSGSGLIYFLRGAVHFCQNKNYLGVFAEGVGCDAADIDGGNRAVAVVVFYMLQRIKMLSQVLGGRMLNRVNQWQSLNKEEKADFGPKTGMSRIERAILNKDKEIW